MPNVIASRSIANEPFSTELPRTKRRPSAIALPMPGRSAPSAAWGSWGCMRHAAIAIARQLTASTR